MEKKLSCADCSAKACGLSGNTFPSFCTSNQISSEMKNECLAKYQEEDNKKIMEATGDNSYWGGGTVTRVQETIAFAKKLNVKKIGIATCIGLVSETRALSKILRHHGFEVYAVSCKSGVFLKDDMTVEEKCKKPGANHCNPILQASKLKEEGTELNIVMGLCVGHDSLFYKYSDALVTTLVTKDKITGHNPAAVLYQLDSFYQKLLK